MQRSMMYMLMAHTPWHVDGKTGFHRATALLLRSSLHTYGVVPAVPTCVHATMHCVPIAWSPVQLVPCKAEAAHVSAVRKKKGRPARG